MSATRPESNPSFSNALRVLEIIVFKCVPCSFTTVSLSSRDPHFEAANSLLELITSPSELSEMGHATVGSNIRPGSSVRHHHASHQPAGVHLSPLQPKRAELCLVKGPFLNQPYYGVN